eukprot:274452-Chlamydomonas_euryale.AAC.1
MQFVKCIRARLVDHVHRCHQSFSSMFWCQRPIEIESGKGVWPHRPCQGAYHNLGPLHIFGPAAGDRVEVAALMRWWSAEVAAR